MPLTQDSLTTPAAIHSETAGAGALLQVSAVTKRFGNVTAVDRLSLEIKTGEFFALLGPSGCGKTTLLRMLAGFETPEEGEILLGGDDIAQTPPHRRPVNMMFQSYALFPHLDVAGNIAFGLKRAGLPRPQIDARVAELMALVRLEGFEKRRPHQLSGGQRQRVALARSLALRPRLLLLDEPMAALDRKLREMTQAELKALQRELGMTFIIVTHDQDEAMAMADRIGVMNRGQLAQVASPRDLYERPNSRWIAGFVGDVNLLEGTVESASDGHLRVQSADAGPLLVASARPLASGAMVAVALRPEKLRIVAAAETGGTNELRGTLVQTSYLGAVSLHRVRLPSGRELQVRSGNDAESGGARIEQGQPVTLTFAPEAAVLLES